MRRRARSMTKPGQVTIRRAESAGRASLAVAAPGNVLSGISYAWAAIALVIFLFITNAVLQPSFLAPSNWASLLAVASPFVITALAQAPAVLSGNGGLDLSVGPFAGFVTVLIAAVFVPAGLI